MDANMDDKLSVRRAVRGDLPVLVLFLASLVAGLALYPRIQGPVPMHWNFQGQVDQMGSPLWAVLFFPLMAAGVYVLLLYLPVLDPRRANYSRFAPTMRLFRWTLVVSMTAIQWVSLAPGLGLPVDPSRWVRVLVGALFAVLGNSLGQLRSSYFVGIRTPWTLADDRVWQRTHRIGGRLLVVAGLVGVASGLLGNVSGSIVFGLALSVAVLYTIVFSYLEYRRLNRGS